MAPDSRGRRSTGLKRFWKGYSLSIILSALFLVSWGLQTWAGWVRFSANQEQHHDHHGELAIGVHPPLTFVVLTASFTNKGSYKSKDSDEGTEGDDPMH